MAVLFTIKVLGQFLPDTTTTLYSSPETYALLASAEKSFVQARGSQISASTSLTVNFEHSNDGVNWTSKGTAPINGIALTTAAPNLFGSDAGATPGGAFQRVSIKLGIAASAFVEVWVTGRSND